MRKLEDNDLCTAVAYNAYSYIQQESEACSMFNPMLCFISPRHNTPSYKMDKYSKILNNSRKHYNTASYNNYVRKIFYIEFCIMLNFWCNILGG